VKKEFSSLVNPGRNITKQISELTRITNEELKTSPKFDVVFTNWKKFMIDSKQQCQASEFELYGHNISFDMNFLRYNLQSINRDVDDEFKEIGITNIVDTEPYAVSVLKYP